MADQSNVYGAAQPLQGNVSDWIANQENMDFRKRAEDRQVAELNRLAQEREQAKRDKLESKYKALQGTPTGIRSVDEFQRRVLDDAMNKRLELYKKERAGQQLSIQEKALFDKLENTPEMLAMVTKAYTEDKARYLDGLKKGEIKRDADYELRLDKMIDGAVPFLDDEGNMAIGIDKDGDGKPDIITFDPNEGLSLKPSFIPNVDFDKTIKTFAETIDTTRKVTDKNYVKTTSEGVPLAVAQEGAKGLLYNRDGSLTPFAVSQFYDAGYRDLNTIPEEEKTKMEQAVVNRILASKKTVNETDIDYGAINAAKTERRQAAKDAKENAGGIGSPVTPTKDTWGVAYKDIEPGKVKSVPVTKKVILPAVNVNDGKGDEMLSAAQILNYTYDAKGNLLIDAAYSKGKLTMKTDDENFASTLTDKKQFKATKETEARIAKELGMSPEELKASATNQEAPQPTAADLIAKYRPK